MKFVELAHGIIENRSDNAAVAVSGRAGIALGEPEMASRAFAFSIESKFKVHASGIIFAAGETEVFRKRKRFGPMPCTGIFSGHKAWIVPD